jgi:hypothetical protein
VFKKNTIVGGFSGFFFLKAQSLSLSSFNPSAVILDKGSLL